MIVLDTNVLCELMRPGPSPAVFGWVAAQLPCSLYTMSITQAELLYGIATMPRGRRRDSLAGAIEALFAVEFAGRILLFGGKAAARYAEIVARRRGAGQPIQSFDALIAATALAADAAVATRDIGGFSNCGLTLIDPWVAH